MTTKDADPDIIRIRPKKQWRWTYYLLPVPPRRTASSFTVTYETQPDGTSKRLYTTTEDGQRHYAAEETPCEE